MAKMTDDDLLRFLDAEADSSFDHQTVTTARTQAVRDYMRLPYGNEEDGRSSVVASDVFDSVEGMLPDLVEVFVGSEEAVRFDPVGPEDEAGAKQATDACNYVFYKQNNGFLILYTVAKDALMLQTGGVKWCWDERRTPSFSMHKNVPEMQLAMHLATNPKAQVVEQEEVPQPDGTLAFNVKIKTVETKGMVRVFAIPADELRVSKSHNSILLDDCPYVAHVTRKSLSDITQMGFNVTADDVRAASDEEKSVDRELRDILRDGDTSDADDSMDPSQVMGWLREEYVLCDYDGDKIAERRKVIRLGRKILSNDECSHVQIAAWTPYILTHQFRGLSVAEIVSDFQRIQTDIVRQALDNNALANNQETVVLTDRNGAPMANIDDLLNRRVGGVIRELAPNAVRPYSDKWSAIDSAPLVEMMHSAKENRTGWTRYSQGLDADSLNKTWHGQQAIMNASQKRMKLMSRIMAEALVAPMFRGIFKTLTDYCIEKLAFRMNGRFVQYDPQEWRDAYDMTINVGIGTGDKLQQIQMLSGIEQAQAAAIQGGGMGVLITPTNIYNLQKRKVELAGFKDANEFWTQPPEQIQSSQQPPDPKVQADAQRMQLEGAKLSADQQKFQASQQSDAQKFQADAAFKASEAEKDRQFQIAMKEREMQFQAWLKAQETAPPIEAEAAVDPLPQMAEMLGQSIDLIGQKIDGAQPESVVKVRDKTGRMIGARITQADGSVREVTIQ